MGRVFLCYRPLHPPTGVEHCCFARLTGPRSTDLVLAHANVLEVYTLHTLPDGAYVGRQLKWNWRDLGSWGIRRSGGMCV
jgi:hypothetical protein